MYSAKLLAACELSSNYAGNSCGGCSDCAVVLLAVAVAVAVIVAPAVAAVIVLVAIVVVAVVKVAADTV
jgi:hypothetical protein